MQKKVHYEFIETHSPEEYIDALLKGYVNAQGPAENVEGYLLPVPCKLEEIYCLLEQQKEESPFLMVQFICRTARRIGCDRGPIYKEGSEMMMQLTEMADGGLEEAMIALADLSLEVLGSEKDYIFWLRFAKLFGSAEAAAKLSFCYEHGNCGVSQSERKAKKCAKIAKKRGYNLPIDTLM